MALGVVVLGAVLAMSAVTHDPVGLFTRDETTVCAEAGARLPPYTGSIAVLNYLVWSSAASLSLLVAVLVPSWRRWLLGFAALLLWLTLDDVESLHEIVGPKLGVPEHLTYAVYAMAALLLLGGLAARGRARGRLAPSDVPFLAGGFLLAVSILVDAGFTGQYLAEDGPKLLGALLWLTVPLLCLPSGFSPLQDGRAVQEPSGGSVV
jgi:hypothetical protein